MVAVGTFNQPQTTSYLPKWSACELLISKWMLLITGLSHLFIETGYSGVQLAHTFCQL